MTTDYQKIDDCYKEVSRYTTIEKYLDIATLVVGLATSLTSFANLNHNSHLPEDELVTNLDPTAPLYSLYSDDQDSRKLRNLGAIISLLFISRWGAKNAIRTYQDVKLNEAERIVTKLLEKDHNQFIE